MIRRRALLIILCGLLVAGCEAGSKGMVDVMDSAGFEKAIDRQVPINIEQPITLSITIEGGEGGGGDVDAKVDSHLDERKKRP